MSGFVRYGQGLKLLRQQKFPFWVNFLTFAVLSQTTESGVLLRNIENQHVLPCAFKQKVKIKKI